MSKIQRARPSAGTWLAIVLVSRYFAGRDLDGRRRTNATFLRHADRDLTPHGRASRWAHRRHAERAAWRTGTLLALCGAAYGYLTDAAALERWGAVTVALCIILAAWRATVTVMRAAHMRRLVTPLYRTIAPLAALPPGDNPARHITVPVNYKTSPDARIRLWLNPEWEGALTQQKAINGVMSRRLDGSWDAYFKMHVHPPYAEWHRAPEPPGRVTLTEFAPCIDAVPENVLALGRGTHDSVQTIDLDGESPHVAVSCGTGGGKSDTVAGIIAAFVRKGCQHIDVIDPKRVSHNWARGLPGVYIHRYVEGQMKAIQAARVEMDNRYNAMDADDTVTFDRWVLIIEEQNSLIDDLDQYWDDYRAGLSSDERSRTPKRNPAIGDLRYILNKGRQCRINVISIYQRMSAKAAGGGDARENYGAKILARCTPQTWKILVGATPISSAARSRIPGRAAFVLGDETHIVQRAYAGIARPDGSADREGIARLRAFALNGRPDIAAVPAPEPGPVPVAAAPEPGELISLREACDTGVLAMRYGAACKARQRDREFPAADAHGLYKPADLARWQANRPGNIRARRAA